SPRAQRELPSFPTRRSSDLFDLVDNAGEGTDSVGVYTGGAAPTTPAVNLAGTGIDLHTGHPFRADLAYDGINLNLTLTDTTAPEDRKSTRLNSSHVAISYAV